jgi:hypothetical protein
LLKVHKLFKERGVYEQVKATIEPSFFLSYAKLASDYTAGESDSSFDPFILATETTSSTWQQK